MRLIRILLVLDYMPIMFYLNGSLTTKVDDDSYAGINTLGEATATVFW